MVGALGRTHLIYINLHGALIKQNCTIGTNESAPERCDGLGFSV
jgi:hypothetical protein